MSSIAKEYGYFWQTLWDDPANAELRGARKDPNVLLPQDRVSLPPKNTKQEPGETEMRHRFVLRGEPTRLRLRLLDQDQPRANKRYTLEIDGKVFAGITDARGRLQQYIPSGARKGTLTVGENQDVYELDLGDVDPIESVSGVQARLSNLGYPCDVDGLMGEQTQAALRGFQRAYGLPESGEPDDATRKKLVEAHGC